MSSERGSVGRNWGAAVPAFTPPHLSCRAWADAEDLVGRCAPPWGPSCCGLESTARLRSSWLLAGSSGCLRLSRPVPGLEPRAGEPPAQLPSGGSAWPRDGTAGVSFSLPCPDAERKEGGHCRRSPLPRPPLLGGSWDYPGGCSIFPWQLTISQHTPPHSRNHCYPNLLSGYQGGPLGPGQGSRGWRKRDLSMTH